MLLLVGLGNPGEKYQKTRHNLGFVLVEQLGKELEAGPPSPRRLAGLRGVEEFKLNKKTKSLVARFRVKDSEVILAKPQTFMNLSGQSVRSLIDYFRVSVKDVVVVSDDSNLEVGEARVRFAGEAGGHKGLQSIIEAIGGDFWRVRVGIGSPPEKMPLEDYVLENFSPAQRAIIDKVIDELANKMVRWTSADKFTNQTIKVEP